MGEPGDVAALVDRIKEAPAEEVVETFLAARQTVKATRALAELLGRTAEALAPAFAALGRTLLAMQQEATQQAGPDRRG